MRSGPNTGDLCPATSPRDSHWVFNGAIACGGPVGLGDSVTTCPTDPITCPACRSVLEHRHAGQSGLAPPTRPMPYDPRWTQPEDVAQENSHGKDKD